MNHLYVCSICQVEIEALAKRRRIEIDTFIKVGAGGGVPAASLHRDTWGPEDRRQSGSVGGCALRRSDFYWQRVGFGKFRPICLAGAAVWGWMIL